ncbi:MAG: alpha/beta hydrolase [archaeon]|nr:alpha/beta hydrolase [archaeon]
MTKISVNGIDINYQEEGAGFPVILIHGLSDDSTLWAPLMPEFSRHYWAIALDVRGHGHSGKPDMPYSIQLFSEDLLGFLKKLEIPQAHLLGLSMGGAVAQQFALDHPEKIRSLILLSTFSYNDSDLRDTFKMLRKSLVRGGFSAFFDEAVKLVVTPEFASANADAIAEMKEESVRINSPTAILHAIDACMDFDVKDRMSQISHPTLIISGRKDVLTSPHLGEQIHRSIKGSEWKIMEGVGHNLLIPEKTSELARIILEFLGCH